MNIGEMIHVVYTSSTLVSKLSYVFFMTITEHIFKAYDIRGLVASELGNDLAYRIGRAFVQFLRAHNHEVTGKKIVVGYDMRPTSLGFHDEVIRGITDEGENAVDIGLTSTPVFNFTCAHYPEHAGGIMVTASHNPAEYNGFKITMGDGLPVGKESGMQEIKSLVMAMDTTVTKTTPGTCTTLDALPEYLDKIFSLVPPSRVSPLKIVVDGGNGMANVSLPRMLEQLPVHVTYMYMEPDGTFPNHEANPLKVETLKDLQAKVKELHADFGFALDGDADRIGLVDEQGNVVDASFVGALIGLEVFRTHHQGHMLYDLRSSSIIPEMWQGAGATIEMSPVGHALIKKRMKETNAIFASELSLHLYFHDMGDLEATDLALLYILQLLSREQKPLSALINPLKKYVHSGERNFEVVEKDAMMQTIEEAYKAEATEVSHLDGLWMRFDWGWLSVRKSNTEPVLRLNLEARDKDTMEQKVKDVTALIEKT